MKTQMSSNLVFCICVEKMYIRSCSLLLNCFNYLLSSSNKVKFYTRHSIVIHSKFYICLDTFLCQATSARAPVTSPSLPSFIFLPIPFPPTSLNSRRFLSIITLVKHLKTEEIVIRSLSTQEKKIKKKIFFNNFSIIALNKRFVQNWFHNFSEQKFSAFSKRCFVTCFTGRRNLRPRFLVFCFATKIFLKFAEKSWNFAKHKTKYVKQDKQTFKWNAFYETCSRA